MKKIMKRLAVLLVAVVAVFGVAKADDDRVIETTQLPQAAQVFIKKYFGAKKVVIAKEDAGLFISSYDVIFSDGTKLEFDNDGNWTEVKCNPVPANLVPKQIQSKINELYPGTQVLKIERDGNGYELKLSNRQELEFDTKFRLTDIDD